MWGALLNWLPALIQSAIGWQDSQREQDRADEHQGVVNDRISQLDDWVKNFDPNAVFEQSGYNNFASQFGWGGSPFSNSGSSAAMADIAASGMDPSTLSSWSNGGVGGTGMPGSTNLVDFFAPKGQSGYDAFRNLTSGFNWNNPINELSKADLSTDFSGFNEAMSKMGDFANGQQLDYGTLYGKVSPSSVNFDAREAASRMGITSSNQAQIDRAKQETLARGLGSNQSLETLQGTLGNIEQGGLADRALQLGQNNATYEGLRASEDQFGRNLQSQLLGVEANFNQSLMDRYLSEMGADERAKLSAQGSDLDRLSSYNLASQQLGINSALEYGRIGGELAHGAQGLGMQGATNAWGAGYDLANLGLQNWLGSLSQQSGMQQFIASLLSGNTGSTADFASALDPIMAMILGRMSQSGGDSGGSMSMGLNIGPASVGYST